MTGRLTVRLPVAAAIVAAVALPVGRAAPEGGPRPVLAGATTPLLHANSLDGQAILNTPNLAPGEERSGRVTITNRGHDGALYLVAHQAAGSDRGLSEMLRLSVADVTEGRTLTTGPLATSPPCRPLGRFATGASHTYEFTVALPRSAENQEAGRSARVDFEWLETALARDECPSGSEETVELPPGRAPEAAPSPPGAAAPANPTPSSGASVPSAYVTVSLPGMRVAIDPGPYRFAGRRGTAKVGVRCLASAAGACAGRVRVERWASGRSGGPAMASGRFSAAVGRKRPMRLRLTARARHRVVGARAVAVRVAVTARAADGRRHRAYYRGTLLYRR